MLLPILRKIFTVAIISQALLTARAEYRAKRIFGGLGLLLASWILGLIGIFGGIGSIFFALAEADRFIYPSLIAGGISLLLAIVIALEGIRLLKR